MLRDFDMEITLALEIQINENLKQIIQRQMLHYIYVFR